MKRRSFVRSSLALAGTGAIASLGAVGGLAGCATTGGVPARAKVVVVGGGYGGATAAKYVRLLSDYTIDVVLIEPNASFVSCPMSNLVLGGSRSMADITVSYDALARKHGVTVVRDMVAAMDVSKKTVTLAGGATIGFDKLVLSPGIDLLWNSVEGLRAANASGQVLQAWKAGPETLALRKQLEAMPDGGVYALTIP
jgi:NADPH-dependent 2,4-dienoyl-CoA reductase/sulfur reductase-like enzyme